MDKTPVKIHLFSIEESLGFALNVYEMVLLYMKLCYLTRSLKTGHW